MSEPERRALRVKLWEGDRGREVGGGVHLIDNYFEPILLAASRRSPLCSARFSVLPPPP